MTMNCPRKTRKLALALSLLLLTPLVLAQKPAATAPAKPPATTQAPSAASPSQAHGTIIVNTTTVVVPVTVKDQRGNLVADLRKEEFRIFEDDVEQRITRLITEAYPISMVVLIDNDLKRKDADQVEPSLISLVGGMSIRDEAFVCRFDQYFHEGKGFTKDQDKLITELRRTEIASEPSAGPPGDPFSGPSINGQPAPGAPPLTSPSLRAIVAQPTKALDDAVYEAAMLLKDRDGSKRRKVILLISDGRNGAKFNTHTYDVTRAELLQQGIAVYTVATGSSYFERKFNRLLSYAHDTGGDIYFGIKQNTFSEFYSRITEEARNQYTLIYSPSGERKVDYHTIEVRVRREGMTILTRKGYYGGTFATEAPR
jgi:VWFA-related protein